MCLCENVYVCVSVCTCACARVYVCVCVSNYLLYFLLSFFYQALELSPCMCYYKISYLTLALFSNLKFKLKSFTP